MPLAYWQIRTKEEISCSYQNENQQPVKLEMTYYDRAKSAEKQVLFFASSAQDVLSPEMHILSNCSYHLHQLGTYKSHRYNQGMIFKPVLPLGWVIFVQFTCWGLFALHCVSAWGPLSAQPQLGFKHQNPWTKWMDRAMIWMSSYWVFWRIHRMNRELRTVCFLLVELWMSSGQQWFLILWRNQSTFCDSCIMEMAHLQQYFYSPNDEITIRRPCQKRRDTYWETLVWARFGLN